MDTNYNSIFGHLDAKHFQFDLTKEKIELAPIDRDDIYSALSNIDPDKNLHHTHVICRSDYFSSEKFMTECSPKIKDDTLSIMNFNIRSIPKNLNMYINLLSALKCTNLSFICLTENFLKNHNRDIYNIPGYSHLNAIRTKKGGGVSLFVKNGITFKLRSDLTVNNKEYQNLFIEIDKSLLSFSRNIIIGVIYRPPSTSIKAFNEQLEQLLSNISQENKFAFITGDFNINTYESNGPFSEDTQDFQNILLSHYYYPMINKPTRVTKQSATLIDNIYTNITSISDSHLSGIIRTSISDHFPIFTILNKQINTGGQHFITRRNFCDKSKAKFTRNIKNTNWNSIYLNHDASDAYSALHDAIKVIFDSSFPEKEVKITYKNRHIWITSSMQKSIHIKSDLYTLSLVKPSEENLIKYTSYKNKLTSILRIAERNHFEEQLDLSKYDVSKTWKIIKSVIGKENNKSPSNKAEFNIHSVKVNDEYIISNAFNNYFVNVGKTLAKGIQSDLDPTSYIVRNIQSIVISFVSENEILNIVDNLHNSSPGWDGITVPIIKANIQYIIKPLTHAVNKSFTQGVFPDYLKVAKIYPIYKSGDIQNICNYRPISVLSIFAKVFEKCMYNYLIDFIDDNQILHNCQFGFRSKHSTQHAIVTLVEKVSKALDNNKIVVGVFLDLKKAFDTVNHQILLRKLEKIGVRGTPLLWLKSYLTNRKQYVSFQNHKSETKYITCGVPQGSVLGPLLFIIYINDLPKVTKSLYSILFADDTNLFLEGSSYKEIIAKLNPELVLLSEWFKANKLSLNLTKTHFMVFHRAKFKSNDMIPLKINNNVIEKTESTKFLGVIIDNKLTWTNHIVHVKNKIAKGIGIIHKARKYLNKQSLIKLYYSFVHPYLIYCVEAWGNAIDSYLDPIIKLQKKSVRLITSSPFLEHTEPIFKKLNILPFTKLVVMRIAIMMYKYHIGDTPHVITSLFTKNSDIHNYNTRQANLLRVGRGKTESLYRTFTFRSVHIWNFLTKKININVSIFTFKRNLKRYLLNNSIDERYSK